jgi:hypothetical protein
VCEYACLLTTGTEEKIRKTAETNGSVAGISKSYKSVQHGSIYIANAISMLSYNILPN